MFNNVQKVIEIVEYKMKIIFYKEKTKINIFSRKKTWFKISTINK
jgi:hypothetical protein